MESMEICSPEWFEAQQKPSDIEKIYPVPVNEYEALMLPKSLVYKVHLFAGPLAKGLITTIYQGICNKNPSILYDEKALTEAVVLELTKGLNTYSSE